MRVIALLLASILLWSGLSTVEAPHTIASSPADQQYAAAQAAALVAAHEGSVEHPHLDTLPPLAQLDAPNETPGLPSAPLVPGAPSLALMQPRTFVPAGAGSPFLAGPLRPPSSSGLAG
jgi:hypothetical protein